MCDNFKIKTYNDLVAHSECDSVQTQVITFKLMLLYIYYSLTAINYSDGLQYSFSFHRISNQSILAQNLNASAKNKKNNKKKTWEENFICEHDDGTATTRSRFWNGSVRDSSKSIQTSLRWMWVAYRDKILIKNELELELVSKLNFSWNWVVLFYTYIPLCINIFCVI